jgi:hypothetical protein
MAFSVKDLMRVEVKRDIIPLTLKNASLKLHKAGGKLRKQTLSNRRSHHPFVHISSSS